MSRLDGVLLGLGGAMAVAGTGAVVYLVLSAERSPFRSVLGRYEARLEQHAKFLMMRHTGSRIARLQVVAVALLLALWLISQSAWVALLAVLAAGVPPLLLARSHRARVTKLERQLDGWLLILSNTLKATPSLVEAISSSALLLPCPFHEEIDLALKEIQLGTPLQRALSVMARRIGSSVISGALTTIAVASQTGGNLSQTLAESSAALREAARLEGTLRTKTAEGRGQLFVLGSMPFVLLGVIGWLDPSWFEPLYQDAYGQAIVAFCAGLWCVACVWACRIVEVEL